MSLLAIARITFEGVHAWGSQPPDAPRRYLSTPHRHLFHVEVAIPVSHGDRQVEILELGRQVRTLVGMTYPMTSDGDIDFGDRSCEHIAEMLAYKLQPFPQYVRVFEDNENGAEWRP